MTPKSYKKNQYSALIISEYFLFLSYRDNKIITNKKLQKLLYYAQAWGMTLENKPLFKDKIEAWVHGPAVRSVYKEYKKFGFNPIEKDIKKADIAEIKGFCKNLLDDVWKIYGKHDAQYLELLTHNEAPWQEARSGIDAGESSSNEIKLDTMKKYYSGFVK